jgi:uncharacterized protein DUF4149
VIRNVFRVLFVLSAGSLWSLAAWVTPTLFRAQGDRHVAGVLAARLFSIETYVVIAAAVLALLLPGRIRMGGVYAAAGLLAVDEWVLKPLMESARSHGSAAGLSFGAWHGVSAVLYVIACLAVLLVVWKENLR